MELIGSNNHHHQLLATIIYPFGEICWLRDNALSIDVVMLNC